MQLPMMPAAERHRELIADFEADRPGLGKPQVMGIAGLPAADQTRLRGDKLQMRLVTQPLGFTDRELALVDPVWDQAIARRRRERRGCCGGDIHIGFFLWKKFLHRAVMAPAVIIRRARDWCRIIRVQSDARLGVQIR